jgi:NAD(P)-dependent dehydrogenase (short-subunit alcohol dehydrogenase family)
MLFDKAQIKTTKMIDELREQDSVTLAAQKYKLVADIGENDQAALDILVTNQQEFDAFENEHPEVGIGELDMIFSRAQVKTNEMLDDLRERYAIMASLKYQLFGTNLGANYHQQAMDLMAANQQELDTFINKQPELSVGELDMLFDKAQIKTTKMIDELREQDSVTLAAQKYKLVADIGENDQEALDILVTNQQKFDTFKNEYPEVGISELDMIFSRAQVKTNEMLDDLRERYASMASFKYQLSGTDLGANYHQQAMDLIAANQQELDTFINKQPELSVGELDILFNNAQIQTNRMIADLREQDSVTLAAQKYRLVDSTGENDQRTLRVLAANQQMFDTHVNNQLERGVSFDQLDIEFSQAQAVVDKTISNLRDEDDTYMSAQKYQLVAEVGKNDQRAMDIVADHQLALDTLINEQRHLVFNMDDLDILVYRAQSTLDKAMYDMRARSEEMDDYFGLDTNTTDRITVLRETPGTKRGIPEPYKLIPTPPVTKESPKKEKPLGQGSVTHPNYVVLTTEGLRCHGILCKYPVGVTAEDIVLGWEGFECQGKFYYYPEKAE